MTSVGVVFPTPRNARFQIAASVRTVNIRQFKQFPIANACELQELKKFGVNVGNFVSPFSFIWAQPDLLSMNITSVKACGAQVWGSVYWSGMYVSTS